MPKNSTPKQDEPPAAAKVAGGIFSVLTLIALIWFAICCWNRRMRYDRPAVVQVGVNVQQPIIMQNPQMMMGYPNNMMGQGQMMGYQNNMMGQGQMMGYQNNMQRQGQMMGYQYNMQGQMVQTGIPNNQPPKSQN